MHDIVVVGGSAGALEAVFTMLQGFSRPLKASIHVVLHSSESGLALVPDLLQRRTRLKVRVAAPGDRIRHGVVYLPPPDHHLLLEPGHLVVNRGPKQNRFRPAIDALFTSAAASFGPRVVGIILSGLLDDGVHGLRQIQRAGGVAVIQAPDDAAVPVLPMNALRAFRADHVVAATRLSKRLERLSRTPARKKPMARRTTSPEQEKKLVESGPTRIPKSPPSPFTCPECDGSLWETHDIPPMYHCHVGHMFTASSLLAGQKDLSDQHMWRAVRSLEEQAEMHRRFVPSGAAAAQQEDFRRHADALEQRALILRRILIERIAPPAARRRAGNGRHGRRVAVRRPGGRTQVRSEAKR